MTSLFKISGEYQVLFSTLAEKDEWQAEDMTAMNSIYDSLEDKAINVAAYIKNLEAEAVMVAAAKADMDIRQKSLERKADRLREYLLYNMQSCHVASITKSPLFKIKVKHNPPAITVVDETLIPESYYQVKQVSTLDKKMIKSDIDRGLSVPGAIVTTKTRLEIK